MRYIVSNDEQTIDRLISFIDERVLDRRDRNIDGKRIRKVGRGRHVRHEELLVILSHHSNKLKQIKRNRWAVAITEQIKFAFIADKKNNIAHLWPMDVSKAKGRDDANWKVVPR